MDAPLYPPARAYHPPRLAPYDFNIDTVAVGDLIRSPAIRAILNEEIPYFDQRISNAMLVVHLFNFTLRNLSEFGVVPADKLPRIDERVRALPVSDRPGL